MRLYSNVLAVATCWSFLLCRASCFVFTSSAGVLSSTRTDSTRRREHRPDHVVGTSAAAAGAAGAPLQSKSRGISDLHASSISWLSQFWRQATQAAKETTSNRSEARNLKQQLLEAVGPTQRGVLTTAEQREEIDRLITALERLNPNAASVTSESLSALWILQWTTEREILFLMEKGLLGLPSGPVQQRIDVNGKTLSNAMLFGPDSKFEVFSSIAPEDKGPRVNFMFEACKLQYRGFILPLPPVGKGWFESVYLDEDFRVTRDVRGDVAVLIKSQD